MKLDLGRLNRRIRIESRTETPHADYGTPVVTWSTFALVWANMQDQLPSKAESIDAGIRIARRPIRIRMRYLRGITSDMRVKPPWGTIPWGSRHWWTDGLAYQIVGGPAELGNRDGIELMVQELSSTGEAA